MSTTGQPLEQERREVNTNAECRGVQPLGPLAQENDLLARFECDAERAGLVGEKKNAKIVLLVAMSAKLPKPLNLSVGGASSAGKNYLIGIVAGFIPETDKKILTGMSPKALMHSGENEFEHKAVFIAEYEGVSGADYAIRTMQSEQVIEWHFADHSKGNGIEKRERRVKGPAAFIQATTRVTLHPENETRQLFIEVDESDAQTRAINAQQALEAEKKATACPPEVYRAWQGFLASLESKPVRIPFASQLADRLPSERVRSRRDFPKLLGLIEASAFLHQHRRSRDERDSIVAAPQDYLIAKELFEHCYCAGPDSRVGELLKAAGKLGSDFCVADLMQETGWGKSKTYAVLNRAEELGNVAEREKRGRYRLLHSRVEPLLTLPAKIRLSADDFRISTGTPPENFRNSTFSTAGEGASLDGKTEN
ncbi:MAG TPA: hypothetical protein VEI26_12255 [Terriglobales bacterium]|nr:hypothetical protein [Terriglobales bacterium]